MSEPVVLVEGLTKTFKVPVRPEGLRSSIRSLFRREHRLVEAVSGVSFEIGRGEVVGFLGPNGAGKTTTLKMLAGIVSPTAGTATVAGFEPFARDEAFLRRIALIMGNRNQLEWDLPAADSFRLQAAIYGLSSSQAPAARDELVELLDLGRLLDTPVRNLSLGERMKMEIAVSLQHQPSVLFLDEPTLGLDLTMQRAIRGFLARYNRESGSTMMLTSHYMADVEALCDRVIVIDKGRLCFDGTLSELSGRFGSTKTIGVEFRGNSDECESTVSSIVATQPDVIRVELSDGRLVLQVPRSTVPVVASQLLSGLDVVDLTVEDPPIESVIEQAFGT